MRVVFLEVVAVKQSGRRNLERTEHPTCTDAATVLWVCENGHVDDHHLADPNPEQRCSRCGGNCQRFTADLLAREYTERLRVNVGLLTENTALKRGKLAQHSSGDQGLRELIKQYKFSEIKATSEAISIGAEGNLAGEREARVIAAVHTNTVQHLEKLLSAAALTDSTDDQQEGVG
jgi:hypothetical protein